MRTIKSGYSRVKGGMKRRLGIESEVNSSASLPNLVEPSGSPNPAPQTIRRAITPHNSPNSETFNPSMTNATLLAPDLPSPAPALGSMSAATPVPPNQFPVIADSPPGNDSSRDSWPGLKLLMRLLGSTSGRFPPLKAAIDGFSDLIEVFESAAADDNKYNDLRKKLDSLLEDLSHYLGDKANLKMSKSMINLCTELQSELRIVEQRSNQGSLRRHLEAVESCGEVLECYRRMQGHLERLMLNANLNMWETIDRIEREARLRQLSPTNSAVYDSAKSEEIQRRTCTAGTRESELAKLLGWACNKEGAELYWMNGMAGTGKTTIAYSLCAELETTGRLAASFFCSRLIPECRDVKLIIPAIAYQLARFSFPFWFALSKALEADPDVHARTLKTQFERLLAEPLLEVKHTLPTHFVVVIDALDECDNENSIGQILDVLLSQTSTFHLPIRFLLSSRPEPQIYSRMAAKIGIDHHTRLVLHELDETKVRRDIEIYLKAELDGVGLTPSQLDALAAHSGVLFIYASTASRYIKGGLHFRQYEARLNTILGLTPPSKSRKDRDIDTLYMSILTNSFERQYLEESDQGLMKVVVDTVICAQEPLTVAALAALLGFKDLDLVEALLGPLRSVLNISEQSGLVTTLHASFPDFMCNHERSARFHCDIQTTHDRIAQECFRIIATNELQFNICGLESSHLLDKDVPDLVNRAKQAISIHLLYACHHWITHLEIEGKREHQRELMHGFLSKRLLVWMEVLNVKESMHLGPGIMQRAEKWSRAHECSNDTIDLAHDAWRFVTMYASHAVSQSTPHIYISMLPFWPEYAPVSKHYTTRMQGAIQIHGLAMTRRQLALLATWSLGGSIWSFCFSQGESLIACAVESSVWILDGTTGRAILGPLEHSDRVKAVAFSHDDALLVSCSNDKTVKVWRTKTGELAIRPFEEHTDFVNSVALFPDGKRVASGCRDGTIRVWSLESGGMVTSPLQGQNDVWSIVVSSDGSRIASGDGNGTIQVWGTESGQMLLGPFTGHDSCVRSVCFSPDGMRLASGSDDNTIRLWSDLDGQAQADILEGHSRQVTSVAFSPDGKQLVSGSADHTVRLWDVRGTPQLARVFTGHTNVVYCVWFSSDGARIVSSSGDRTIRVWDARSQGPADSPLERHTQAVTSVAFSHGGSQIVSGSNDGTIYVWDGQSGEVTVGPMKGHSDWVYSVCISPDETRIASGSEDKDIQLWDACAGQTVTRALTDHSGSVFSVCFSPDGALLASGSEDNTIRLWNAQSGEPVGEPLTSHTSWVRSVCFLPDGLRLVTGSDDETVLVWEVKTRKPVLPPLRGHTGQVYAVCMSSNGTRIASGSHDATVRLWDANYGQCSINPLLGHTAAVRSVCFSPDSSYVVSGSDDKTIRLWDARCGQAVGCPLVGHTAVVRSIVFSPDDRQIVSGSEDFSIRVWDIADLVQPQEPKDDIREGTEPPHAHQSWVLQDNGWVVDSQSRLLAWVPPDLHTSLMSPRNTLLISTKGSVQLDFESAKLGESWTECYEPTS